MRGTLHDTGPDAKEGPRCPNCDAEQWFNDRYEAFVCPNQAKHDAAEALRESELQFVLLQLDFENRLYWYLHGEPVAG